ncbi:hypothetical protein Tco_0420652 [Tanacetum coccineum]
MEVGLAISLPFYLVDACDVVEDDCFDGGAYDLDDDFHSQHHDDHHGDDAPPEKEKQVKSHMTYKHSKSTKGSSSKQSAKESITYVSEQQQQQKQQHEWYAWVEETIIDEDEVICEDETPKLITEFQNVDKHVPTIFDRTRMEATLNDMLSNLFRNAKEMGILEEKKYVLLLHKIHTEPFPEADLEEMMNLDKPNTGLIYLNSKNEKWVMYLVEIVKFCDATLEKVLKEVKLKIFQSEPWKKPPLLGELDRDIIKAYEKEINKRLRHQEQMRRRESFVNERPILPTMKHL